LRADAAIDDKSGAGDEGTVVRGEKDLPFAISIGAFSASADLKGSGR
jgi:hypothetical protein